jgi:hypothetical protein
LSARRPLAPESVDQAVSGHDLVGVQQEEREQRALLPTADRDDSALQAHLDNSEHGEFHAAT